MKRKRSLLATKLIADLGDAETLDQATAGQGVDIPLPPDLSETTYALAYFVANRTCGWYWALQEKGEKLTEEQEALWNAAQYMLFQDALAVSYQRGFKLALLRYSEDLKTSAEASRLLETIRQASQKGAAARSKQAAPARKAIRARFRALKKTVPKKTARYARLAKEFGMSERNVQRIVNGLD